MNCEYCDTPVDYVKSVQGFGVVKEVYKCHRCGDTFSITKYEED